LPNFKVGKIKIDRSARPAMKIFAGMSIRFVLGQIIGVLGLMLFALSAAGLYSAVERNDAARRVASLAATDQQLFAALLGFRLERGTTNPALISVTPADNAADTRIATNREVSETGYRAAVERLAGTAEPGLAPLLAKLTAAHETLAVQRTKSDAAIHQPKPARDPAAGQDYPKSAQIYLDSLLALIGQLEASTKLVDPMVDQLLMIKQSAWAARNYGGLVAVRIENAAAAGQPWSAADIVDAAEYRGRAALAWDQFVDAAARPDAPAAVTEAVARSKDASTTALVARKQEVMNALSSGQKTDVPVIELQKLNTASLGNSVDVVNAALSEMVNHAARQTVASTRSLILNGIMLLLALAVTVAGFVIVHLRVSTPIRRLTTAMRRLADHDLAAELHGADRADEIGDMSRAVEVFKQNMIKADGLAAEQQADRTRKEQRQAAVEGLIGTFDQSVTDSLRTMATASTELRATAQLMTATAEETGRKSTVVASASQEASTNVQTVAAATEQLSASIAEISRQVIESTSVAGAAVAQAEQTNNEVNALAEAAQRIGDVVKLINAIAGQTNLLALNATIEAARAGEAGKGFAVVASEVKSLATQTAKATDEIAAQVTAIQGATGSAVKAIQNIGGTIMRVNQIAAAIAAAVEQQGAATREIARNVQHVSVGTTEVSTHIAGVSQAANETGSAAAEVHASASTLAQLSDALRTGFDRFVGNIRAA
jgi:methyl-accepting chemotaxis protein